MPEMNASAVRILVTANIIAFLCQLALGESVELAFGLWPLQAVAGHHLFHVWQIVTYAFLHDPTQFAHIGFNMFGLWMFGSGVERVVGPRRLMQCYFASVVTAALSQLLVPGLIGAAPGPTIGASGGVFGLLLAYAWLFPTRKIVLLFPPVPMPAWLFATLYAGLELVLGLTGSQASVAHFAHLGGMIGSWLVISGWRVRYRP